MGRWERQWWGRGGNDHLPRHQRRRWLLEQVCGGRGLQHKLVRNWKENKFKINGKNKKKLKPDIISINKTVAMKYSILAKFLTNKLTLQIQKQYPLGNGKVTNDSKCIISFMRLLGISIRLRREAVEQWQARGVRSVLTAHSCSFCTRDTKTLA